MSAHRCHPAWSLFFCFSAAFGAESDLSRDLVGHWTLRGDCQDHSGQGNHGLNHGVDLAEGAFDGKAAWVEVPASESLRLGTSDFTFSAWIYTEAQVDDALGDVLEMYDPDKRRGVCLSVNSSASGYLSEANDRHVYFGIDNAKLGEWEDCGRPSATSPYVSNSMIVFRGHLYAATMEGATEADWAHVWRYEGGRKWTDCGRVGNGRTTGVGPLLVHNGELHAVTTTYDWTRVREEPFDPGKVYRYAGGKTWVDLGTPVPDNRTLNSASSYQGKLYVGGGPNTWAVSVQDADGSWRESHRFDKRGPRGCFPHAMGRYNGLLFTCFQTANSFDGTQWTYAGAPVEPQNELQAHCFAVFQGSLIAGTWPLAKVARWRGGETWEEMGRVGDDGTEVNSLLVYNGKLYGGSIPRSEVCRYDGQPQWTTLRRFHSPPGWTPVPPRENEGAPTREQVAEWSRVTSMTIHRGRLFAGMGNCTSSIRDAHSEIHGSVHSMEAGKCVSYDEELAPGWRHLTAVRQGGRLRLYVDGILAAESPEFTPGDYDLSTDKPLRIGVGQTDFFHGKIREVRAWKRALEPKDVGLLAANAPAVAGPSQTNLPGQEFPRINEDRGVTFRLRAPEARQVTLEGGEGLLNGPLTMTKGEDGAWTATTRPAAPGFHYHWFMVDGLRVNDPGTRQFFGWGRDTSGVEVPDADGAFYAARADVPHGAVGVHWYHSRITGQWRKTHVYTPPGYESDATKRFPVLYLLHGAGENERSWNEQGRANFIMDNLLAEGRSKPFLIVMDTGYAAFAGPPATDRGAQTAAFEEVMLQELIPFIDGRFRTLTDPKHRAMAGLSMGGGQTLRLALKHLDRFAWIAAMSSPGRDGFDAATAFDGVFKDAAAFHAKARLLWLGAGTAEESIHRSCKAMHDSLTAAGIRSVFYSSEGTHHEWQTWRRGLRDLAPRLFASLD